MNIGILLGETLDPYQINTIELILQNPAFNIKLAVINDYSDKTGKDFIKRKLKKSRKAYFLFQKAQELKPDSLSSYPSREFFRELDIDILTTPNPGSPENVSVIQSYLPEVLILLGGFDRVNKALLELTRYGVLSFHFGDLRKYRGEPPAFWELYNGKNEMLVTVQKLTERYRCGMPVLEKKIEITFDDDLKSLREKAFTASEKMMVAALNKIQEKDFIPENIKLYGRIYHIPTLKEYSTLAYRLASRKLQHKIQTAVHTQKNEPNYI